ncbi:MAG: SIS domain-containing protein [Candidatus Bathyarchaeota archaeon]|nr:SIS domain-containing protein [Candidatus Bathyarchaeota archaeon]
MDYNMIKHIHEGPKALENTLTTESKAIVNLCSELSRKKFDSILITGCGSSYHVGVAVKYTFENLMKLPVDTLPADEVAYPLYPRQLLGERRLVIIISRSGEKGDSISAARKSKECGAITIAVTASPDSLLAQEMDKVILTHEGSEFSQPKTKSVISAIGALNLFAIHLSKLSVARKTEVIKELEEIPGVIERIFIDSEDLIKKIGNRFKVYNNMFLAGSGPNYATAIEGALKLKETCGIHAEGYTMGEVTQGPPVLLGGNWVFISLITSRSHEKALRMLNTAKKMGAKTLTITTRETQELRKLSDYVIRVPVEVNEMFAPLVYIPPLHLLAYYIAEARGLNPDNPKGFDLVLKLILEPGRKEPEMM